MNMIGTEIVIDTSCCAFGEDDDNDQCSLNSLIEAESWTSVRSTVTTTDARTSQTIHLYGRKTVAPPLHLLCKKKRVPIDIVSTMIDWYPEAVRTADSYFQILPIHVACRSGLSVRVIDRLLEEYPESLSMPDDDGNLPLHLACSFASMDVILHLTQRCGNNSLLESCNLKNQTPLHLACSRENVSHTVVKQLMAAGSTKVLSMTDWQGQLPLHKAVMWNVDCGVLEILLKAFPDAVRALDNHQMTPYGICRKRLSSSSAEASVRLLRRYHRNSGAVHQRVRDALRFQLEAVGDAVGGPAHRRRTSIRTVATS